MQLCECQILIYHAVHFLAVLSENCPEEEGGKLS